MAYHITIYYYPLKRNDKHIS